MSNVFCFFNGLVATIITVEKFVFFIIFCIVFFLRFFSVLFNPILHFFMAFIVFETKFTAACLPRLLPGTLTRDQPCFENMQYRALCTLFLDHRDPTVSVTLYPVHNNYIPNYGL